MDIKSFFQKNRNSIETTPSLNISSTKMEVMDPRAQGIRLEELIHTGIQAISTEIRILREQEIRTEYADQSINGIDHWIQYGTIHIFAQTKWRDTTTQPEVSQFLSCVDRIQARIPADSQVVLLWIGKVEPTKHSMSLLAERNVEVVCSSVSVESLARNVVCWVGEIFGLDPGAGLCSIPIVRRAVRTTQTSTYIAPPKILTYDETEEGKAARSGMESYIQEKMLNVIWRKIQNYVLNAPVLNVYTVFETTYPSKLEDWSNGKFRKINFNGILKTFKGMTYPTKQKPTNSYSLFAYCRLRFISTELAALSLEYGQKRDAMISAKSAWAKNLPTITCKAEPMTDEEYRGAVVLCNDYYYTNGKLEKVANTSLNYQFFNNYFAN
jgi:hypothetical protein